MAELNTDVRFVRGVGEARAKSLAKLGITDLKSLISYFPRAYEDRRESRRIAELQVGERACVTAMALALCVRIYKEYGTLDAREIRRLHG